MREISPGEVYKLEECLRELAAHHNAASSNFGGCFPKKPFSETIASFEKDIKSGRSRIAVVESEDKILGFCKADIDGCDGKIDYLIVLKQARGSGYGNTLTEWAMDVFAKSGVRTVEIRVVDGNDAVNFYERYGFKTVSHIMRKDLK